MGTIDSLREKRDLAWEAVRAKVTSLPWLLKEAVKPHIIVGLFPFATTTTAFALGVRLGHGPFGPDKKDGDTPAKTKKIKQTNATWPKVLLSALTTFKPLMSMSTEQTSKHDLDHRSF